MKAALTWTAGTGGQLALILVAEQLPQADPMHIGKWGFSRGGLVTYGALTRTDRIAAAIIGGGPTDLVNSPRRAEFDEFVYPYVIRDYAGNPEAALARLFPGDGPSVSQLRHSATSRRGDPRVTPYDALRIAQLLQQRQVPPFPAKAFRPSAKVRKADFRSRRNVVLTGRS